MWVPLLKWFDISLSPSPQIAKRPRELYHKQEYGNKNNKDFRLFDSPIRIL